MATMAVPSLLSSCPWEKWSYRLFGLTTEHLKHEFYLWICLSLLTISTLQGVYRQSFATKAGDFVFCGMASLWLSRHVLVRWLITCDSSTSSTPTIIGLLTHWLSTLALAGQYCDRPNLAVATKHLAINQPQQQPTQDDTRMKTQVYPSLLYTIQLWKLRCWYPLLGLLGSILPSGKHELLHRDSSPDYGPDEGYSSSSRRSDRHHHLSSSTSSTPSSWTGMLHPRRWVSIGVNHGPALQFLVRTVVLCGMSWYLFVAPWAKFSSDQQSDFYEDGEPIERNNFLRVMEAPTWSRMSLWFVFPSTLLSLVLFGRVILPIPNLVAGENVLPSVRSQARSGYSASSKSKKHHNKTDTSNDMPWAERYYSISQMNRFRLFCKVTSLRILDAVFVCVVLPRTTFTCRATGHCSSRPMIWELSTLLHPAGLTGPRAHALQQPMFASMSTDHVVILLTSTSVFLISLLFLLAQLTMLEKSHLAIMGYVAGEWTKVKETSSVPKFGASAPTQWDPRRRYEKGDLILYQTPGLGSSAHGSTIYKAASHSPEGPPFDLFLRATHDFFRNELGHPSTSYHVAMTSNLILLWSSAVLFVLVCCKAVDYPTDALMTTLVANIVACHGLVKVGRVKHTELIALRQEISPVNSRNNE